MEMDFGHEEIEELIRSRSSESRSRDGEPFAFDQVMIKVEDIKREPDTVPDPSNDEGVRYSKPSRQTTIQKTGAVGFHSGPSKGVDGIVRGQPKCTQLNSSVTLVRKGFRTSHENAAIHQERASGTPVCQKYKQSQSLQKLTRNRSTPGTFDSAAMKMKVRENEKLYQGMESPVLLQSVGTNLKAATEMKPLLQKTPSGVVVLSDHLAGDFPQKLGRSYNMGKRVQCPKCNEYVLKRCARLHSRYYCGVIPSDELGWKINSSLALCLLCNKCQEPDSIEFHVKYLCGKRNITVQCFYCPRMFSDYRGLTKHMRDAHHKRHRFNDLMSILPQADSVSNEAAPVKVVKHFFNNSLCAEVESYLEEDGDPEFFCFFCSFKAQFPYEVLEHMEDHHDKEYNTYDVLQAQITGVLPLEKNADDSQNSGFANYQLYEPRVILKHSHHGVKQEVKVELREGPKRKKLEVVNVEQKQITTEALSKVSVENRSTVDLSSTVQRKIKKNKINCLQCNKAVYPDNMRMHKKYLCGKEPGKQEWVLEKNSKALCLKCKKVMKSSTIDFHVKYICNTISYSIQCFYCTKVFNDYRSWIVHSKKLHNRSHYYKDLMTVLPNPEDANDQTVEYGSQSVVTHPFVYNPPTVCVDGNIEVAKFSSEDDIYSCFYCDCQWKAGYKVLDHMEDAHGKIHTMYDLLQAKMANPCQAQAGPSHAREIVKNPLPVTSKIQDATIKILANNDPDYVDKDKFKEDPNKNSNVEQMALLESKTLKYKLNLKYRKNLHSVSSTFFTDKKKKRTSIPEVQCMKCKKTVHPGDMRIHKKYHCKNELAKKEWILKNGGKSLCLKCRKMVLTRTIDFHVKFICKVKPFSVQCFYCTKFYTDYRSWMAHIKMAHNKTHYYQDLMTILPEPDQSCSDESLDTELLQRRVEHPFTYTPPSTGAESSSDCLKFPTEDDFFFCFYCGCKWTAAYKVLDHMEDAHGKIHNMYDLLAAKMKNGVFEAVNDTVDLQEGDETKSDCEISSKFKTGHVIPRSKVVLKVAKKKVNIGSEIFNMQKKKKKRPAVLKVTCLKCGKDLHPEDMRIHKKYHCGKELEKKEWILYSSKALCLKCNKLYISNSIDFHCKYVCQKKAYSVQCFYCTKYASEYRSLLAHMQKFHNKSHYAHDFMSILPEPEPLDENSTKVSNTDQKVLTHPFIYTPPATLNDQDDDQSTVNSRFPPEEDFYSCFYCGREWKAGFKLIDHMEEAHGKKHDLYDLLRAKMAASSDNSGMGCEGSSDTHCLSEVIEINEDEQSESKTKSAEISQDVINIESDNGIVFDFTEGQIESKVVTNVSSSSGYYKNAKKLTETENTIKNEQLMIRTCHSEEVNFEVRNLAHDLKVSTPIVITVDCAKDNDGDVEMIDMDKTRQDGASSLTNRGLVSLDNNKEVEVIDLDTCYEPMLFSSSSVSKVDSSGQDGVIIDVTQDFHMDDVEILKYKGNSSRDDKVSVNIEPSVTIEKIFTVEHSSDQNLESHNRTRPMSNDSLNLNEEVEITFCNLKKNNQLTTQNSSNELEIIDCEKSSGQKGEGLTSFNDSMDHADILHHNMEIEPNFKITSVRTIDDHVIKREKINITVRNSTENSQLVCQSVNSYTSSSIQNEENKMFEYMDGDYQVPSSTNNQSPLVKNAEDKAIEQDIIKDCEITHTKLIRLDSSLVENEVSKLTEYNIDYGNQIPSTSSIVNKCSVQSEEGKNIEYKMDEGIQDPSASSVTLHKNVDKTTEQSMNEDCQLTILNSTMVLSSSVQIEESKTIDHGMDEFQNSNISELTNSSPVGHEKVTNLGNEITEDCQGMSTNASSVDFSTVRNEEIETTDHDMCEIPSDELVASNAYKL